ncbi:hypothetical protein [Algoriphagus sp. NG3]|uniref:hypothetical protein n=1 Tax=Algoriphagus sp. NG3 TaxID=3097546 RepID=UPI002A801CD9|nr:hypothetical protein [Algoriphagus sp. NG3]WPR74049.1 hypothetical protein SLW71_15355 [Algoriphagus sp. NG3]
MKRLLVAVLIVSFSCKEKIDKSEEIEILELYPVKTIDHLDSFFFTSVTLLGNKENNFIISHNPAFLAITNKDFDVLQVLRDTGAGPKEFSFPTQGRYIEGSLYIADLGNHSIKRFDSNNGQFISAVKIPEPVLDFKFDVDNKGNIYYPIFSPFDENVILKVDKVGEQLDRFKVSFPESEIGKNRQVKHFQSDEKGNLIVVGASLPYIEMLDSVGSSINRFNIKNVEPIKTSIDSLESDLRKNPNSQNNIPMIIMGVQYDRGRLYVSFVDRVGLDRSKARNLLVFRINETSCELEKIFKFRTGTDDDGFHPINFYVDSQVGKLYTQGLGTKHVYVFDLPE